MVIPVDADVDKTEHVGEKNREQRTKRVEVGAVRDLQLQHHDSNDNRDDPIAERFEPVGFHRAILTGSSSAAISAPLVLACRDRLTAFG